MPGIPGLHCRFQMRLVLRALRWIARYGEEPPPEFTALEIVGGYVAACPGEIGAAVSDDDETAREQRCARNGVGLALPASDQRVDLPHQLAGARIERMQPAVESAHIQPSLERREPAVDNVATRVARPLAIDV